MRIIQMFLAAIAFMSAGAAHATFVLVDYTAVVRSTSGTGLGFSVGQTFNGQFVIDPGAVESTLYCDVVPQLYQSCEYHGTNLVASNFTGGESGENLDYVFVSDMLRPTCFQCEFEFEEFQVAKGSQRDDGVTRTLSSHWLRAFDAELDFIHGNGLEQSFELDSDSMSYYANMYGRMMDAQWSISGNGDYIYLNQVDFGVTSLRVATVPEPGTLALLSIGVAGLFAARRRAKRFLTASDGCSVRR